MSWTRCVLPGCSSPRPFGLEYIGAARARRGWPRPSDAARHLVSFLYVFVYEGRYDIRLSTPSARPEFTHAGARLAHGARDLRLERGAREVDLRGTTRSDNQRGIVESTRRGRGAADTCGRTRRAPMSHRSDASIMEG
jgi:hypothetical protein